MQYTCEAHSIAAPAAAKGLEVLDEYLVEARHLAPYVKGPNKARREVERVTRILDLYRMSGLPHSTFYRRIGLNPKTWRYYGLNCHSDGSPWPELETFRRDHERSEPHMQRRSRPIDWARFERLLDAESETDDVRVQVARRFLELRRGKLTTAELLQELGLARARPRERLDLRSRDARQAYDQATLLVIQNADDWISALRVGEEVGGTPLQLHGALHRLIKAGWVERGGQGPATRYKAIAGMPAPRAEAAAISTEAQPEPPASATLPRTARGRSGLWSALFAQIADRRLGATLERASADDIWGAVEAATKVVERLLVLHAGRPLAETTFQATVQRDLADAIGLGGEED